MVIIILMMMMMIMMMMMMMMMMMVMPNVMKCQISRNADAGSMTPSRNDRRYTLRSVQSSPGRSFLNKQSQSFVKNVRYKFVDFLGDFFSFTKYGENERD